eukprot:TRINITY_DN16281_c0_g1_i1.p1 TRINITY_DN16281_c0_g1~~TRINITY_DN16281_c0_g1_i1.p1  ORF type:complete len:318 (+),score=28.21 TRINITY_DN16281_c0_g1_i1:79-1032(+)
MASRVGDALKSVVNALLKHIRSYRILYIRLWLLTLSLQWSVILVQPDGWREQQQSAFRDGYRVGLWRVEIVPAHIKNVLYYFFSAGGAAAIVFSPVMAGMYIWASVSWTGMIAGLGTLGVGIVASGGTILIPICAAVTACTTGAISMYFSFMPTILGKWITGAQQIKSEIQGTYFWPEMEHRGPQWVALETASVIMFTVGLLNILLFLFSMIRTHFADERIDPVLGLTLFTPPVISIISLLNYSHFAARALPQGYFGSSFQIAIWLSAFSFAPAILEAYSRLSRREAARTTAKRSRVLSTAGRSKLAKESFVGVEMV